MNRYVAIVLFVCLLAWLIPNAYLTANKANDVSVESVLTNPEKYDGKHIALYGVGSIRFEDFAVYLSNKDRKHYNSVNAIWINFGKEFNLEDCLAWNGRYVIVEGMFNEAGSGHMNAYSGSMEKATKYDLSSYERLESLWRLLWAIPIILASWYYYSFRRRIGQEKDQKNHPYTCLWERIKKWWGTL